jgi:tripeptidyl-peptidase-1
MPLRFGLKQSNMDRIDEMLFDISHPESPNFGNHWSPEQVIETFAPSTETIDTVRNWLSEEGIDASRIRIAPTKVWIQVNATVEEAERLLQTQYNVYSHSGGEKHVGKASSLVML